MNDNTTYTLELTGSELTHVLAEMNTARMDSAREGFDSTVRSNERLAADLIRQVLPQGWGDNEFESAVYGGKTIGLDA